MFAPNYTSKKRSQLKRKSLKQMFEGNVWIRKEKHDPHDDCCWCCWLLPPPGRVSCNDQYLRYPVQRVTTKLRGVGQCRVLYCSRSTITSLHSGGWVIQTHWRDNIFNCLIDLQLLQLSLLFSSISTNHPPHVLSRPSIIDTRQGPLVPQIIFHHQLQETFNWTHEKRLFKHMSGNCEGWCRFFLGMFHCFIMQIMYEVLFFMANFTFYRPASATFYFITHSYKNSRLLHRLTNIRLVWSHSSQEKQRGCCPCLRRETVVSAPVQTWCSRLEMTVGPASQLSTHSRLLYLTILME